MARKRLGVIPLSPLLIFFAICVFHASAAGNDDLSSYLAHGKWHEEVETEMGTMVQETVFNRDGTFTALARIKGSTYHEGSEGRWEVRDGNILWFYYEQCSPDPCAFEKESTWIKVIDDNHIQEKLGDAYRQ